MHATTYSEHAHLEYCAYLRILALAVDKHSVCFADDIAAAARRIADALPPGTERERWLAVARAYELY